MVQSIQWKCKCQQHLEDELDERVCWLWQKDRQVCQFILYYSSVVVDIINSFFPLHSNTHILVHTLHDKFTPPHRNIVHPSIIPRSTTFMDFSCIAMFPNWFTQFLVVVVVVFFSFHASVSKLIFISFHHYISFKYQMSVIDSIFPLFFLFFFFLFLQFILCASFIFWTILIIIWHFAVM